MLKRRLILFTLAFFVFVISLTGCSGGDNLNTIRVSNQTWTEASIVGHITERMITENTDYAVERVELESNALQWNAINNDQIDVWPSYTSSLFNFFDDDDTLLYEPDAVYDYVLDKAKDEYNLMMLERVGFYNNYDLAVTPEAAAEYNLKTYSDLAAVSDQLAIAADANFKDRADVYPLLQENYGMDFKEIYQMSVAAKFVAVENGEAEVVSCYTTDAGISRLGLVVLEDDKHASMHFDTVYILRGEILEKYPDLEQLLNRIKITNEEMAAMNYQVEGKKRTPEDVAQQFLEEKGLI